MLANPDIGDLPKGTPPDAALMAVMRHGLGVLPGIDVTDKKYGAVGDGQRADAVAMTSGSPILTTTSANFTDYYVGKYIRVEGAGAGGADLITQVVSRQSANQFTLAANALTTVLTGAGCSCFFGTNNTAAIQAALDDAYASGYTRTVFVPPGIYLCNVRLRSHVIMVGCFSGNVLHGLPNPINLASRQVIPTALMPAVATLPVIYGDVTNGGVFGGQIHGFSVVGSMKKTGYGIKFGENYGVVGDYFGNIRTVISHCSSDGFDIGISSGNAVDGEVVACWANDCNIGFQYWKHDGLVMRNCSSTTTGTTIKVGGSKNLLIPNGNYNWFNDYWLEIEDSQVFVGTVNVEEWAIGQPGSNAMTALVKMSKTTGICHLHADFINFLGTHSAGSAIAVRNFVPEANKHEASIRISNSVGLTYCDSANTRAPLAAVGIDRLRFYTDNTFATLNQTEKVSRAYVTARELKTFSRLYDEFVTAAGVLGWGIVNVSGAATASPWAQPGSAGEVRIASGSTANTNVYRYTPGTIMQPPNQRVWELRWRFLLGDLATAVFRMGIYEATANVKPQNGLGIRLDTSVPDATVQLEIINAGVSTVVNTGVTAAQIGAQSELIMQKTNQGVSCVIRNVQGAPYQPEVLHAAALPGWSGWMGPAIYMGVSATGGSSLLTSQFEYIEYHPNGYL